MKSRIVVWSIVGAVVLVGVIFIITRPRVPAEARMTPERMQAAVRQTEVQVNRLAAKLSAARTPARPPADPAKAQEADRLLNEARNRLSQLKSLSDLKQGEQVLREAKQSVRLARRAVELALGPTPKPGGL